MTVQSGLPNLPPWFNMVYTDKEGNLTPNANLYNDEMYQVLSKIINNGVVMPSITTSLITLCRDDVTIPVGTIWFNTNAVKLQVKTVQAVYNTAAPPVLVTPGVIETIQSV